MRIAMNQPRLPHSTPWASLTLKWLLAQLRDRVLTRIGCLVLGHRTVCRGTYVFNGHKVSAHQCDRCGRHWER